MTDLLPARTLLDAAYRDLKALTGMLDEEVFVDEIFGLHVQQSVEKSLKAWIATLGEIYPYTHDLSTLLRQLDNLGCEIDFYQCFLPYSSYASRIRYAGAVDDAAIDRESILEQTQLLYNAVNALLQQSET